MQYRKHRYPTQFPIRILTDGGCTDATLIDINETGARIEGDLPVERGDKLRIVALNERVTGVVRWVGSTRAGVYFTPMIPKRTVDVLRRAERGSQAARFTSLGLQEMR